MQFQSRSTEEQSLGHYDVSASQDAVDMLSIENAIPVTESVLDTESGVRAVMAQEIMMSADQGGGNPENSYHNGFSGNSNNDPNAPGKLARLKRDYERSDTPTLDEYGNDYSKRAADGKLDPCIGRTEEINSVIGTLIRRSKNNPIIIGEPGVGKTAIVEELAFMIQAGMVPELEGKRIVGVDMGSVLAGAKYRGEFEERMKNIIDEVKRNEEIILFIDEIHTIVGAGAASGALDAANMLKPALARGEFQVIGATTLDEYRKHIESDRALQRRFQPTMVEPPTAEATFEILKGIKDRYEMHHKIKVTDEALKEAARLSDLYISDRFQPDKAIDLLDEAASRMAIFKGQSSEERVLTPRHIAEVISALKGFSVGSVMMDEREQILDLEEGLTSRVIGQDHVMRELAKAEARRAAGVGSLKRGYSYIFSGPTGVGKTLSAQVLAELTNRELIRFDMSEYMESHTASKLIGAPPGYVGFDEGGQLTEAVRRNPHAIVLFDELEKAHPDVWNMALQIMEDGILTDSQGRRVDFRSTLLIMTTNAGAKDPTKTGFGFGASSELESQEAAERDSVEVSHELVKFGFPPELLGRATSVFEFNGLNHEALKVVVGEELRKLGDRVRDIGFDINFEPSAVEFIIANGTDLQYGARPVRRALTSFIEDPLADKILKGEYDDSKLFTVTWDGESDSLSFS